MDLQIVDRTAVISGAAGDVAHEKAKILLAEGCRLIMTDRDADELATSVDRLKAGGGVRTAKAFIPPMRKAGWGRVVFVTSENVAQPYPDEAVYDAKKAALLSFAKAMSQVYLQQGVLVNCVAPAFIATDMADGMMKKRAEQRGTDMDEAIESFLKEERPHLVLKRRGRPEEVGFITASLLLERASFVNCANYRIDGGSVQAMNI